MILPGQPARRRPAGWLLALAALAAAGGVSLHAQADGTKKWGAYSVGGFIEASPAVAPNGTIYLGVRHRTAKWGLLLAIPPNGGQPIWQFVAPDWIASSPAVGADGTVYVGCADGKLYAFDPNSTGNNVKPRWQYDTGVAIGRSSPAIGPDGTIYIGTFDGVLHAVTPTGTNIWKLGAGNSIDSSPAIARDGTIYFGCSDNNIYAVNAGGSEQWRVTTGGPVLSSPAIGADGTIYIGSTDFRLYAIAPNGTTKWSYRTDGRVDASPVIGPDGTIYVGSWDFRLYAINPDGTLKWTGPGGRPIVAPAVVRADGTVIYGCDDGKLRAVNPADATAKWTFPATDIIEAAPVIAPDGTIYVAQLDGSLWAINGNGSPLSTYSSWPMFQHDAVHSGLKPPAATGGQLLNLSTRAQAGDGSSLIAGLFVTGDSPKKFLLRGIGPTLGQYNVTNPIGHPRLELFASTIKLAQNDAWGSDGNAAQLKDTFSSVGAFPLPDGSNDTALLPTLVPGGYTAVISSADGGSGVALVEAYDAAANSSSARLINLSTRGRVVSGGNVIPGLYVGGGGSLRLLIRAAGPGLTAFGVNGALARPTMTVFNQASGALLASNEGWTVDGKKGDLAAAMQAVGAFPFADGSADCAVLLTLNSGSYTIPVAGVGGTTGEVLVEVYVVP